MKFCPECKSVMLPRRTGRKTVLTCSSCGHTVKKFRIGDYKLKEGAEHKHARDILIVEEKKKKDAEEERKYIVDLYGTETYEGED